MCFSCYECHVPFTQEEKKGAYPIGNRLLCYTHAKQEKKGELAARRKGWGELANLADVQEAERQRETERQEETTEASAARESIYHDPVLLKEAPPTSLADRRAHETVVARSSKATEKMYDGSAARAEELGSGPILPLVHAVVERVSSGDATSSARPRNGSETSVCFPCQTVILRSVTFLFGFSFGFVVRLHSRVLLISLSLPHMLGGCN